ncbi:MAG: hypothetical protein U5K51_08970 [Flavobacteriaceae bacterium]|nr:hypothetical protein [Flavobacteriaceae bacterium]
MTNFIVLAQIIVAISVAYVWIFRYDVIIKEFKQFGLSDLTRTFVGASKVSLATLLIAGIWFPPLILIPAHSYGIIYVILLNISISKLKNPFIKRLPSLILLILCVFITLVSMEII